MLSGFTRYFSKISSKKYTFRNFFSASFNNSSRFYFYFCKICFRFFSCVSIPSEVTWDIPLRIPRIIPLELSPAFFFQGLLQNPLETCRGQGFFQEFHPYFCLKFLQTSFKRLLQKILYGIRISASKNIQLQVNIPQAYFTWGYFHSSSRSFWCFFANN